MQSNRTWMETVKRAYQRYDQFMEKQGFPVVLTVCVLVIVLSALYTFHFREQWDTEREMAEMQQEIAAAGAQSDQTLQEAQKLVSSQKASQIAVPTEAPFRFSQPVEGFLDRDFSMTEPQYYPQANYWRLHPGIDLQAEYGAIVTACSDGEVLRVWEDNELGLCIRIRHGYGYESVYAGLSNASYVKAGDPVRRGQTIGHLGNGVLAESDAQPHLHFEMTVGDLAVDPLEYFSEDALASLKVDSSFENKE